MSFQLVEEVGVDAQGGGAEGRELEEDQVGVGRQVGVVECKERERGGSRESVGQVPEVLSWGLVRSPTSPGGPVVLVESVFGRLWCNLSQKLAGGVQESCNPVIEFAQCVSKVSLPTNLP